MAAGGAFFTKNYGNLEKPFSLRDNIRLWKIVKRNENLLESSGKNMEDPPEDAWKTILYDYNCYYDEIYRNENTLKMQYTYLKQEYDENDLVNNEVFDSMVNDPKELTNKYRHLIYPPSYDDVNDGNQYFPGHFGWDYELKTSSFDGMYSDNLYDKPVDE